MGNLRNVVRVRIGRLLDLYSVIDAAHRAYAGISHEMAVVLGGKLLYDSAGRTHPGLAAEQ